MLNKSGATQWTIGKLMTIVLLIIVLVLVVYGVSTNGLGPLIERAGGMFDSVQILFGFGDGDDVRGDCGDSYSGEIEGVGKGMVTRCRESCSINFEESLSFGKEFNWTQGDLFVKKGSKLEMILDIIDNLPLAVKEREVNKILIEDYENYMSVFEDGSFMDSRIIPIYILVKGDLGGKKYFKWVDETWFEENNNEWERRNWNSDEGLNEIYSESKDLINDDEISYRVGNLRATRIYHPTEGDDSVSFENIRASDDSYKLLDIFVEGSGQIDSDSNYEIWFSSEKDKMREHYEIFQVWFSSERDKIIEYQKSLDEEFRKFGELLSSESSGDFEGEPYYLSLTRDSDGEGVFYLKTSSEKYGLKGERLELVKDYEEGWKFAESWLTLSGTDEGFEERIKIHQIRKFLEVRCE